ncbi:MAG: hypothetical protein F4148_08595 [Caldilineaceae bacterium SB0675_bin_29]|uniref:CHAT domain-containing protein n=1 Tax=Caldilineaceae bacterium SB0675_bin_29 TaxID=2605266 RepID=A0A6B1G0G1_9CHLR|nr:hypothetical protein [Caldilineaceae bacterium SB0675_bin_29]
MKLEQRIYCIEGVWDWGDREVEPSVEPLLEMLSRQGQWSYVRRDCATAGELKHYLDHEWARCRMGSVLYIATHGGQDTISMSGEEHLGLDTLGEYLEGKCEHCLVHFSGCEVLGGRKRALYQRIKMFLDKTGAMGVSGYGADVGWTDASWAPAAALELVFFSSIREQKIDLKVGRHFRRLNKIVRNLQDRFEDCEFDLYTRSDARIRA